MGLTRKNLMGGDKMARPGGVRTMQDEIDMGLRDKDGVLKSEETKAQETQTAEEENTQAAPEQEQTTDAPPADDGEKSSESDGGGESEEK